MIYYTNVTRIYFTTQFRLIRFFSKGRLFLVSYESNKFTFSNKYEHNNLFIFRESVLNSLSSNIRNKLTIKAISENDEDALIDFSKNKLMVLPPAIEEVKIAKEGSSNYHSGYLVNFNYQGKEIKLFTNQTHTLLHSNQRHLINTMQFNNFTFSKNKLIETYQGYGTRLCVTNNENIIKTKSNDFDNKRYLIYNILESKQFTIRNPKNEYYTIRSHTNILHSLITSNSDLSTNMWCNSILENINYISNKYKISLSEAAKILVSIEQFNSDNPYTEVIELIENEFFLNGLICNYNSNQIFKPDSILMAKILMNSLNKCDLDKWINP